VWLTAAAIKQAGGTEGPKAQQALETLGAVQGIIKKYDKTIYDIRTQNMHQLILDLKDYPSQYSVYAFGEFIHYIDKNTDFNSKNLAEYLKDKKHQEIMIQPATTTIEAVFMDL